jgi:hypothetical protein
MLWTRRAERLVLGYTQTAERVVDRGGWDEKGAEEIEVALEGAGVGREVLMRCKLVSAKPLIWGLTCIGLTNRVITVSG